MRTAIFNQGFNRIEYQNIIHLERGKLNRLLDEERRAIEALTNIFRRKIEAAPHQLLDVEKAWNKIQEHSFLNSLRQKINLLTDAYPEFASRVEDALRRLRKRVMEALETAKQSALRGVFCH